MPSLDSTLLASAVEREAALQGVDPALARSIFQVENWGRTSVDTQTTSPKGAFGIMQVMPETYKGLIQQGFLSPTNDLASPVGQIKAGIAAIKERMAAGITDPVELAISYNGSPKVLEQYKKTGVLPPETTDYIKKFSATYTGKGGSPMATTTTTTLNSSKETTTTSGRNIPDDQKQGLLDASSNFSSFVDSAKTQLGELTNSILSGSAAAKTAVAAEGQARGELSAATGAVDQGKLASQNNILSTYGINLNDPANQIQENMKVIAAAQAQRAPLTEKITQMQATSPLSDPIGWLANLIPQSQAISQHNALVRKENEAISNIQTLQALATNQSQIQPAAVEQALKDKQLAEAKVAKADADAKIAGIENNTQMQIAKNLVEQSNLFGADMSQRLQVARVIYERQTQTLALNEHDKAAKEEVDKLLPVNLLVTSIGLPVFTPTTFKALPRDTQERLIEAGQFNRWGQNAGEAISTLHKILGDSGMQQLAQKDPLRGKFLQEAIMGGQKAIAAASAAAATNPALNDEIRKLKDNDLLQWGITRWANEKKAELKKNDYAELSKDSPYRLDYNYAANLKQLGDNTVAKFVREYAPNGVKMAQIKIDDQTILQKAVADVTINPASLPKVAKDIQDFYEIGYANQNMQRGVSALGIDVPRNYPVWSKINTWTQQPVQMLNAADIERFLMMQVSAGRAAAATSPLGGQDPNKIMSNIPGLGLGGPVQRSN